MARATQSSSETGRPLATDDVPAPESLTFLLDDQPVRTLTPKDLPAGTKWVYDHPHFLLLNLAVGGGWPGNPDASTVFPQDYVIDWVRVWQREAK